MFTIEYTGDLRCRAIHIQSGSEIETDAPTDNKGKGERFSPTDLLCVSLTTCMITTLAIKTGDAARFAGSHAEVKKIMRADPRSIGRIEINMNLQQASVSESDKPEFRKIMEDCPVGLSIHPDIEVNLMINW